MSRYMVHLEGCDDDTFADVELTDEQAEGVRLAGTATRDRSTYGCQPVMSIVRYEDATNYARETAEESHDDEH